jgi:hypothetical protein
VSQLRRLNAAEAEMRPRGAPRPWCLSRGARTAPARASTPTPRCASSGARTARCATALRPGPMPATVAASRRAQKLIWVAGGLTDSGGRAASWAPPTSGPYRNAQPPPGVPPDPSGSSTTPSSVMNSMTMTRFMAILPRPALAAPPVVRSRVHTRGHRRTHRPAANVVENSERVAWEQHERGNERGRDHRHGLRRGDRARRPGATAPALTHRSGGRRPAHPARAGLRSAVVTAPARQLSAL